MGSVGARETRHGRGRRVCCRRDVRSQVGPPAGWRDGSRCRENPSERGVCDYLGVSEERAGEAISVSRDSAHGGSFHSRLCGDAITVFGWCFADISVRCSPLDTSDLLWCDSSFWSARPLYRGAFRSVLVVFKLCWEMIQVYISMDLSFFIQLINSRVELLLRDITYPSIYNRN